MIRKPRKSGRFKRPVDGPKPTGGQLVYEALRQDIIGLRLAPGEPLEELQLCRTYRVSRTPVREALIRLAADDLVALEPNRGAKVASMQFIDVVDHYEAMDIFLPLISYFAAVRRTANDLVVIKARLTDFRNAVVRKNADAIILANFNLHGAMTAACHNGSLEKAYRRMLVDKLRIAQHDIRASAGADISLARRFNRTFQLSRALVSAIISAKPAAAQKAASALNDYVRTQVVDVFSASLGPVTKISHGQLKKIAANHRRPSSLQ
jgi:DNA-binding GntR family transcriptional regulator